MKKCGRIKQEREESYSGMNYWAVRFFQCTTGTQSLWKPSEKSGSQTWNQLPGKKVKGVIFIPYIFKIDLGDIILSLTWIFAHSRVAEWDRLQMLYSGRVDNLYAERNIRTLPLSHGAVRLHIYCWLHTTKIKA